MTVHRYDDKKASSAHAGTIRAYSMFQNPAFKTPFSDAWGYLAGKGALESHAHPTDEVYVITMGGGVITIGDESAPVAAGDVIEIPGGMPHHLENLSDSGLTWFALWWDHID